MNGAGWLVQALVAEGVDTLFGYPGGTIMPFYDALHGAALKHVLVRHEQGAAFAANGYARASGRVGVCVATSGPGASNLVTGIADAMLDSVPMVVITGQVATTLMGTDAFQELDVFGMTLPMVKHSFIARRVEDLPMMVAEAFRLARSGRPGPVLIDLPKDVQMADAAHLPAHASLGTDPVEAPKDVSLHEALALISQAQRPVIYGGGGIALGDAVQDIPHLRRRHPDPDRADPEGPRRIGDCTSAPPGHAGHAWQPRRQPGGAGMRRADRGRCALRRPRHRQAGRVRAGCARRPHGHRRLRDRQAAPCRCRRARRHRHHPDQADLALRRPPARPSTAPRGKAWRAQCQQRARQHAARYDAPGETVFAPALLKRLSELAPEAIVACDVGQHQMWVAQHWRMDDPRKHLTSGALGAMGFGLPAAMGAQEASLDATVICVSGDGSIMMNIQELATLKRYRLPVKIVLLDNQALGMVRQWQELFFEKRYSEIDLSDNPDFVAVAQAFGIEALHIERADQVEDALQALLDAKGPALLHVAIDTAANVWPLVPPNRSNSDMLDDAIVEVPAIAATIAFPQSSSTQEA